MQISAVGVNWTFREVYNMISCVYFLKGCNFRCPFCYNIMCLQEDAPTYLYEVAQFEDAVVLSGGEPTLYQNLLEVAEFVRGRGKYLVLETNGSNPDVLSKLIDVANEIRMDIKCLPEDYKELVQGDWKLVSESLKLLNRFRNHLVRIPIYKPYHNQYTLRKILDLTKGLNVEIFNIDDSNTLTKQFRSFEGSELKLLGEQVGVRIVNNKVWV